MPYRTTEIKKNGEWVKAEFEEIKKGDTFRLLEPDGKLVESNNGRTEHVAASDARPYDLRALDNWSVMVEAN
jgi:hypothetical protein